MISVKEWYVDRMMFRTVAGLRARQFEALSFNSREELIGEILRQVTPGMTVGFGGSVGVRELGLSELLKDKGVLLLDHWREGLGPEEILDLG